MSRNKSKIEQLRSLRRRKKILTVIESIVAVLVVAAGVIVFVPAARNSVIQVLADTRVGKNLISYFGQETFDNSVYDINFNDEDIQMNEMEYNYSTEYINFVLLGIDSRTSQFDDQTNNDSIVIVSVHNTTGEVKMTSVYRDTFLRIYDKDGTYHYGKINSAYAVGGAEATINTLNKNLDLQITDYVTVNFSGVAKIIDSLGGIEVNLTDDEVSQLNTHLKSTISTTGDYAPGIRESGKNIHLNGIQATTYCRIRKATFYDPKTGDKISDDYGRAARQRSVIMKLVEKAKKAGVSELTDMMNTVLNTNTKQDKIIQTSFSLDEMVDMLPIIFKFTLEGSQGFPRKLIGKSIAGNGDCVVPKGLGRNVTILHKFLYGEENYEPTSAVEEIDSNITAQTGIGEDDGDDNIDDTVHHTSNETNEGETQTQQNTDNFDYDDGGKSDFY